MIDPEHKQHIIDSCERYHGFEALDDGYIYFCVNDRGAMSADVLRIIADELDRRNFEWNKTSAAVKDDKELPFRESF